MSAIIEFANRLRNQIDIVNVVEAHVSLRNAGSNLKGLCPFHKEKTPSFTVSPSKQIFQCFGCGAGGDVIKFVQKVEHLEWIEAVRFLSEKFRIPMPEWRSESTPPDEREKLHAINQLAVQFFADYLKKAMSDDSTEISGYMSRRNLDAKLAERFQLGLAPDAWQALLDHGRKGGYERDTMVGAGLVISNQQNKRYYDRFRNRLIFPVADHLGRPIAFGGRVYAKSAGADEPKYVNSPETSVYKKGQHLYALHLAKEVIVREKRALLMEGYMDVIRAHQFGFENAVASCGTALTDEQARVLKKYCSEILFVYDGDAAGQKAMLRGAEILLENEFTVRVVQLPPEHDPDSFLVQVGAAEFSKMLDQALDVFAFFTACAAAQFDCASVQGKVQTVEFMLPLLKKVRNPIARQAYIARLSEFLSVDQVLIARQVSAQSAHSIEKLREQMESTVAPSRIENQLLKLTLESASARNYILSTVDPEWLQDATVRKWFCHCKSATDEGTFCWDSLLNNCNDEEATFLRMLALDDSEPPAETNDALMHAISRLQFNFKRRHTALLTQQVQEFYQQKDEDQAMSVVQKVGEHTPLRGLNNQYFLSRKTSNRKNF